jgi:hypothetical protein
MKRTITILCLLSVFAFAAVGRIADSATPSKTLSAQLPSLQGCWQLKIDLGDPSVVKFDPPLSANVYVGRYVSPASDAALVNRFEARVLKNDGGTIFIPISFAGLSTGNGIPTANDYLATFSGRYDPDAIKGTWSFIRGIGANPNAGSGLSGSGNFTLTKTRCP